MQKNWQAYNITRKFRLKELSLYLNETEMRKINGKVPY